MIGICIWIVVTGTIFFNLKKLNFWPHSVARGISVLLPGIESSPPALEVWSLNHWTTREVTKHFIQFSSVAQSCPTLCDPMNRSMPALPVHHQLPEFTQTHVHRVSDAIQPSQSLSSPSPSALNLSQHQGLFNESALHIRWPKYWSLSFKSVLPMNTQDWSPLGWTGLISLQSKGLSRVFSSVTVQKHHSSALSLLHSPALPFCLQSFC